MCSCGFGEDRVEGLTMVVRTESTLFTTQLQKLRHHPRAELSDSYAVLILR